MAVDATRTPAERIRLLLAERGELTFHEVMEEALYGEGGYYARSELPIGEGGDFITGSSLSGLFGRTTARLLERLDRVLDEPAALLEVGYGDGRHLAAVAAASPGRRLFGADRVKRPLPPGVTRLDRGSLPVVSSGGERSEPESRDPGMGEGSLHSGRDDNGECGPLRIDGVVFSYELFDALPVHRLVGLDDGSVGELFVALGESDRPAWSSGPLSDPRLVDLLGGHRLEAGQIADLAPGWVPLYRRLASSLGRGLLVTVDYGFEREALLDVRVRRHGTLACYRSHRVHRDALRDLGVQDLTAHVDFTALREAGEAEGLETVVLTRQALWLAALGLFDDLGPEADLARRQQAAALLDPEGMGDQLRVLVQARGINPAEVLDLSILRPVRGEG